MADMMTFPDTWEEFEGCYGITDREQIYTNGARLIPSFRVKQWLDHIAEQTEPQTSKVIEAYSRGFKDGADAVKSMPQTDMAEDIVKSYGFSGESYRQAKAKTEPQTERNNE